MPCLMRIAKDTYNPSPLQFVAQTLVCDLTVYTQTEVSATLVYTEVIHAHQPDASA